MTKVMLVYTNSFMDNLIPMGVSLLSACLKRGGHEVDIFDTTFYKTKDKTGDESRYEALQIKKTNLEDYGITEEKGDMVEDFHREIGKFKPDLMGFSVVEPTYHIALKLLKSIKDSGIPTIVGGIHATMGLEDVLREDAVEMICVGEGERAIVNLADRIQNKEDYSNIQNIWVKKGGIIVRNPLGPLADLDSLPDQDWSIHDKKRFYKPMGGKVWISGPIELARGCPHHCAFCCNDQLQAHYKNIGRYPRQRSVDNFMNELKDKKEKFGLQYLYLLAENFLQMSDERFSHFIAGYRDIRLPFWIETRPETVILERIKQLKEVGCEGISIGVEHGNNQFRRKMLNRHTSNTKIIEAFRLAKQAGIRTSANNILGFPEETRELAFETINLNREFQPDNAITNIFAAHRGAKLWNYCVEKGYISRDAIAGDYRSDTGLNMPQFSKDEIRGLHRTFSLYVRLPKEMWPDIRIAERFDEEGNRMFEKLSKIYRGE
ncbi:MAG: radical SAM protein [Nanoarchaeota archaeon]|nr:radical SAM protein [Nanoarchaeota archaeon]